MSQQVTQLAGHLQSRGMQHNHLAGPSDLPGAAGSTRASAHATAIPSSSSSTHPRVPSSRLYLPLLRSSINITPHGHVNPNPARADQLASSTHTSNSHVVRPASALRQSMSMQPRHHALGPSPPTHAPIVPQHTLHRHLSLHRSVHASDMTATTGTLQPHPPPGRALTRHSMGPVAAPIAQPATSITPWSPLAMVAAGAVDVGASRQLQSVQSITRTEPSCSMDMDEPSTITQQTISARTPAIPQGLAGLGTLTNAMKGPAAAALVTSGTDSGTAAAALVTSNVILPIRDIHSSQAAPTQQVALQTRSSTQGIGAVVVADATSPLRRRLPVDTNRVGMGLLSPVSSSMRGLSPGAGINATVGGVGNRSSTCNTITANTPQTLPTANVPAVPRAPALLSPTATADTDAADGHNSHSSQVTPHHPSASALPFPCTPARQTSLHARRPLLAPRTTATSGNTRLTSLTVSSTSTTTAAPSPLEPSHSGYGTFRRQASAHATTINSPGNAPHPALQAATSNPTTSSSLSPPPSTSTTGGETCRPYMLGASHLNHLVSPALTLPAPIPHADISSNDSSSGGGGGGGGGGGMDQRSPSLLLPSMLTSPGSLTHMQQQPQSQNHQQHLQQQPRFAVGLEGLHVLMNLDTQRVEEVPGSSPWAVPHSQAPVSHTPLQGILSSINGGVMISHDNSADASTWGEHLYTGHPGHPAIPMSWHASSHPYPSQQQQNIWPSQQPWQGGSELWRDTGVQAAMHMQDAVAQPTTISNNPYMYNLYNSSASGAALHMGHVSMNGAARNPGARSMHGDEGEAADTATSAPHHARLLPVGWQLDPGSGPMSEYSSEEEEGEEDPEGDDEGRLYRVGSDDHDEDDEEEEDEINPDACTHDASMRPAMDHHQHHSHNIQYSVMYNPSPWTPIPGSANLGPHHHHHLMNHPYATPDTPTDYPPSGFHMHDPSQDGHLQDQHQAMGSSRVMGMPVHRHSEPLRGSSPSSCESSRCGSGTSSSASSSQHRVYVASDIQGDGVEVDDAMHTRTPATLMNTTRLRMAIPGWVGPNDDNGDDDDGRHSPLDVHTAAGTLLQQTSPSHPFRPLLPRMIAPSAHHHRQRGDGPHEGVAAVPSGPRHMMLLPPPTAPASVSAQANFSQSGDAGGESMVDMDMSQGPAGMRLPFQQWMSQHAARLLLPHHMRNMADLFTADMLWSTRPPGGTAGGTDMNQVHNEGGAHPGHVHPRPGQLVPLNRHGVIFGKPSSGRSSHRLLSGKEGPAVDMFCGRYPSKAVRQLASDSRFMAELLTELPGVDPTSSAVMNMVLGLAGHRGNSARPGPGLVEIEDC